MIYRLSRPGIPNQQCLCQDSLYTLWGPSTNENVEPLVQKVKEFQNSNNRALSQAWRISECGPGTVAQVVPPGGQP